MSRLPSLVASRTPRGPLEWNATHAAVWGEGARPYDGDRVPLRLLDSTSFDSGVTPLRFEPQERR